MDKLMQDPEYLARLKESERQTEENLARYRDAARGVLADLAAAGFHVQSVGELVQQFARDKVPYVDAIPILLRWLPVVTYDDLKDDIVRTLSVPWAKPAAVRPLLEEFKRTPPHPNPRATGVRWVIGNALWVLADDSIFEDLVRIAEDRQYGADRQMVILALAKMKNSRAVEVLIRLLGDEDVYVSGFAITALGKLKAQEALTSLERFLQHPHPSMRQAAKKAIRAIERRQGRPK